MTATVVMTATVMTVMTATIVMTATVMTVMTATLANIINITNCTPTQFQVRKIFTQVSKFLKTRPR